MLYNLLTRNRTQNSEKSFPELLTFGIQSPQVGFPCSIKCSKSKNYKVPQTFRDYGTKKSELLNYIFKASSNLPSKI